MANKVRLTICGSSYVISTNESEDYMQKIASYINGKIICRIWPSA